jgi:hypothetical protein
MDVAVVDAEKLVRDVQVAHRIIVAYYESLLTTLDNLAKEFDLDFWYWDPLETSRPCRSSTQPSRNWLWDMIPLYAATHIYKRFSGKRLRKGDFVVAFDVYAEDSFDSDKRRAAGFASNPDPLKLPKGEGLVRVEVYRCVQDSNQIWNTAWHDTRDPDIEVKGWQDVGHGIKAKIFPIRLADLIHAPQQLRVELHACFDEEVT